jgi:hypothetical protein
MVWVLRVKGVRILNWSPQERKERKTRNEVGKGSVKSDEAEESNTRRCSKPANMAKSY